MFSKSMSYICTYYLSLMYKYHRHVLSNLWAYECVWGTSGIAYCRIPTGGLAPRMHHLEIGYGASQQKTRSTDMKSQQFPTSHLPANTCTSYTMYEHRSLLLKCTCLLQLKPTETAQEGHERWLTTWTVKGYWAITHASNSVSATERIPKDQK